MWKGPRNDSHSTEQEGAGPPSSTLIVGSTASAAAATAVRAPTAVATRGQRPRKKAVRPPPSWRVIATSNSSMSDGRLSFRGDLPRWRVGLPFRGGDTRLHPAKFREDLLPRGSCRHRLFEAGLMQNKRQPG